MMLKVLVLFVMLDYITGIIAAWYERVLNSDIGARGIVKKFLLFVIVVLAYQLDQAIGHEIFRSLAIWFYLANEAISVLENVGRCGVPIPNFLKKSVGTNARQKQRRGPGFCCEIEILCWRGEG